MQLGVNRVTPFWSVGGGKKGGGIAGRDFWERLSEGTNSDWHGPLSTNSNRSLALWEQGILTWSLNSSLVERLPENEALQEESKAEREREVGRETWREGRKRTMSVKPLD